MSKRFGSATERGLGSPEDGGGVVDIGDRDSARVTTEVQSPFVMSDSVVPPPRGDAERVGVLSAVKTQRPKAFNPSSALHAALSVPRFPAVPSFLVADEDTLIVDDLSGVRTKVASSAPPAPGSAPHSFSAPIGAFPGAEKLRQQFERSEYAAEAKRLDDELEAKRLDDELEAKRLDDELEAKRLDDELEAKRLDDELEAKRLDDAAIPEGLGEEDGSPLSRMDPRAFSDDNYIGVSPSEFLSDSVYKKPTTSLQVVPPAAVKNVGNGQSPWAVRSTVLDMASELNSRPDPLSDMIGRRRREAERASRAGMIRRKIWGVLGVGFTAGVAGVGMFFAGTVDLSSGDRSSGSSVSTSASATPGTSELPSSSTAKAAKSAPKKMTHIAVNTSGEGFERLLKKYSHMQSFTLIFESAGEETLISKEKGESADMTRFRILKVFVETCLSHSTPEGNANKPKKFEQKAFETYLGQLEKIEKDLVKGERSLDESLNDHAGKEVRDMAQATKGIVPAAPSDSVAYYEVKIEKYATGGQLAPKYKRFKRMFRSAGPLYEKMNIAFDRMQGYKMDKRSPNAVIKKFFQFAMEAAKRGSRNDSSRSVLPLIEHQVIANTTHVIAQLLLDNVNAIYKDNVDDADSSSSPKSPVMIPGTKPLQPPAAAPTGFYNPYVVPANGPKYTMNGLSVDVPNESTHFDKTEYDWMKDGYTESAQNAKLQREYGREVDQGWATYEEPKPAKKPGFFARTAKKASGYAAKVVNKVLPKQFGPAEIERRELAAQIPKQGVIAAASKGLSRFAGAVSGLAKKVLPRKLESADLERMADAKARKAAKSQIPMKKWGGLFG